MLTDLDNGNKLLDEVVKEILELPQNLDQLFKGVKGYRKVTLSSTGCDYVEIDTKAKTLTLTLAYYQDLYGSQVPVNPFVVIKICPNKDGGMTVHKSHMNVLSPPENEEEVSKTLGKYIPDFWKKDITRACRACL